MKNAGLQLFAFLVNTPAFTNVMNQEVDGQMITRLFPLKCDGTIELPLSIYGMRESARSKQGSEFDFTLSFYFAADQYDECIDFLDAIKDVIDESNDYDFIASDMEVNDEDYSLIGILNFKN